MQLLNHKKLHIVAGRATEELVADICRELDVVQGTPNIAEFANGEIQLLGVQAASVDASYFDFA